MEHIILTVRTFNKCVVLMHVTASNDCLHNLNIREWSVFRRLGNIKQYLCVRSFGVVVERAFYWSTSMMVNQFSV